MIIVSCRKAFWDNEELSDPDDWTRQIAEFRNRRMKNLVSMEEFEARVSSKRVLLLVHGYNNVRAKVLRAYRTINKNEKNWITYYDLVIGFTWPGGDDFRDYPSATHRVPESSNILATLLEYFGERCPVVDVMSHSLGGRVSLSAFQTLSRRGHSFGSTVSRQFLFAPAVHNDSIQLGNDYYDGTGHGERCCVFYTTNDGIICMGYSHYEDYAALGCNAG